MTTAKPARRRLVDRIGHPRVLLLRLAVGTCALAVGAGACQLASTGGDDDDAEPVGETEQAVISGSADSGNDYSAVAQIVYQGGPGNCSAFYLGNRTMLTAGHCVGHIISNCVALDPLPGRVGSIGFRFAADNGTVVSAAVDATRRANADAFVALPGAALDEPSCVGGCSVARLDPTNRSAEMVLFHIDADPPANVTPMNLVVHPAFASVSPRFVAFSGIEAWAETNQPLVTFVGFGSGSTEHGGLRGRDVGILQWVATEAVDYSLLGWMDCTTRTPPTTVPMVVVAPDDIHNSDEPALPTGQTGPGWCFAAATLQFGGSNHSQPGCGDSGGPVLAGAGPSFKTLTPRSLPDPPAAGDTYDPGQRYVVGVASSYWTSVDDPNDPSDRPTTVYAPTYTQSTSLWLATWLNDADGDGVLGAWDQFPNCDDNGPDTDLDGVPDECDPCPCDPNDVDTDGDGSCDQGCPGDPSDNCVAVPNPGQENCNADAEIAAGVQLVGDACDPVPCVRAEQTSSTSGGNLLKITRTTLFDVEPIRTAAAGFTGEWGHRFCDCPRADGSPAAPLLCSSTAPGCRIGPGVDFEPNGPAWFHTRVGINDPPALDASFEHDFKEPAELQSGGVAATLETLIWDADLIDLRRIGSHWFHVKREVCTPPCPSGVSQTTLDDLASHYWSGEAGEYHALGGPLAEIPNIFDWWFPDVGPEDPVLCPMCNALEIFPFAYRRGDDFLAMRTPAGDYPIDIHLTPAAVEALRVTTGVRWLAPVEPNRLLFGAGIRLASISIDGSTAGPALQSTPLGMDVVRPVRGSPAPRTRFGTFLRATESDMFVIGGVLDSGDAAGDIWRYDFQLQRWSTITTDGAVVPGAVLAATYDAYTRRVVVLDEIGQHPHLTARLWTLDWPSGAMHLVKTWPRRGRYDKLALGPAHDGSFVLLAGKNSTPSGHHPLKVLRLTIGDDAVTLDGLATTQGTPMTSPRTNQRGIHIVTDRPRRPGKTRIVGERIDWSSLRQPHGQSLANFVD